MIWPENLLICGDFEVRPVVVVEGGTVKIYWLITKCDIDPERTAAALKGDFETAFKPKENEDGE